MKPLLPIVILVLSVFAAACVPGGGDVPAADAAERDDVALDDAPVSELWAPPEIAANTTYTPLRLVTRDPDLAKARLILTSDRDVGFLSPSASSRSREVDGWFYGTSGPGFSVSPDVPADALGPLTFSLRRADDPDVVVASATTELVAAADHPSADACLGGGNVAVWERIGSYVGASGRVVQATFSGEFAAVVADVDVQPAEYAFRRYAVWAGGEMLDVHAPIDREIALGEVISGDVRFPGACSGFRGDFAILDLELGERLSPLRQRLARVTLAWRGTCPGAAAVKLRGCAHFDADNPVLR